MKPPQHKDLRAEQKIMLCGCEALIHFWFNPYKLKFEILKMELAHNNDIVSEIHCKLKLGKSN
jgi:hypothetical protein